MMVTCKFSQMLLHSQLIKILQNTFYNKHLSHPFSKCIFWRGNEIEKGKPLGLIHGNKIRYNLMHNTLRIGGWTMLSVFLRTDTANHGKKDLDYSRVPVLKDDDLEEMFVRGSGPGGQAVNKTNNCVVLTHKPTGIVVKCHESRLQNKNRTLAREMLLTKLDNFLNGDLSVEAQKKALQRKKAIEHATRKKKLAALKEKWRQRESGEDKP